MSVGTAQKMDESMKWDELAIKYSFAVLAGHGR